MVTLVGDYDSSLFSLTYKLTTSKGVVVRETTHDVSEWQGSNPDPHKALMDDLEESDLVDLWWPVGYGQQNLYDVSVELWGKVSQSRCVSSLYLNFDHVFL